MCIFVKNIKMSSTILFWIIIAIIIVDYVIERVLDYLNSTMRNAQIPAEVGDIYDVATYEKQQQYEREKSKIGFWSSTVNFVSIMALFLTGAYGILDSWIGNTFASGPVVSGLLFFGILFWFFDIIQTPFEWYNTFVIEEKFGFNKMTPKIFVLDKIKSWLVGVIIGGIILGGLLLLILQFGAQFWIFAWIAISVFLVFFNLFYSSLIVPLFNKQTPLEEGDLKNAIFEFSKKVGFELDNIYVIDGSKRSTKANAYFAGFGAKKRIVLYDTLMQELTISEIVAVLAHEIGHYKKKHTLVMLATSIVQMAVILFLFGLFISVPAFTEVLGIEFVPGYEKCYASFYVFSILFTPISFFIGLALYAFSRKNEYQADRFAGEEYASIELENALKKLSKSSLSNLTPHPWYVFCNYSHPTLYERIKALRLIKKE